MSREEEITRFVAFCIEQYKRRHGGDGEHVYDRLSQAGALRFLSEHFDVEHCLDPDQITDDIDQIVARKVGEVVERTEVHREHGGRMYGEVTQQNLHLFIPGKIAGVAMLMAKETGRPALEMLRRFYATKTCKLLEREATKYWYYSSAQLYDEMKTSAQVGPVGA